MVQLKAKKKYPNLGEDWYDIDDRSKRNNNSILNKISQHSKCRQGKNLTNKIK